jgi:drug/metabolite transporter (DMT)-like permease
MPIGFLTGLGAALSWGTLDVFSAISSRRIGSLKVTTGIQLVGASLILAIAIGTGTAFPTDPFVLVGSAIVGAAGAGAYLTYFTGLRIGPIAVVSGMVAAYGGLTVVLAVVFRGESLTLLQAAGATVATVGVIMTGVAFEGGLRGTRLASPGVAFAIVALVLFATMALGTDIVIDHAGWLQVLLVSRLTNAFLSVLILIVALTVLRGPARPLLIGAEPEGAAADRAATASATDRAAAADGAAAQGAPVLGRWDGRVIALVLLAGVLDIVGLMVFAYGLEVAETWLVGLVSSFGPAVTIVVAVVFFGERLRPIQWAGMAGILVGMIAIALP